MMGQYVTIVMEINGTEIKYKKWSNQEGPLYSINRSEVYSINYRNGEVELITGLNQSAPTAALSSGKMERDGKNLTINGRELSDEEVLSLVGPDNYETYLSARDQISIGRFFSVVFWMSLGATAGFLVAENSDAATVSGIIADVSFPFLCICKGIGKGRMNWVADEYNRNIRANTTSFQISPSIIKDNSME